jgi:hypothetical protein
MQHCRPALAWGGGAWGLCSARGDSVVFSQPALAQPADPLSLRTLSACGPSQPADPLSLRTLSACGSAWVLRLCLRGRCATRLCGPSKAGTRDSGARSRHWPRMAQGEQMRPRALGPGPGRLRFSPSHRRHAQQPRDSEALVVWRPLSPRACRKAAARIFSARRHAVKHRHHPRSLHHKNPEDWPLQPQHPMGRPPSLPSLDYPSMVTAGRKQGDAALAQSAWLRVQIPMRNQPRNCAPLPAPKRQRFQDKDTHFLLDRVNGCPASSAHSAQHLPTSSDDSKAWYYPPQEEGLVPVCEVRQRCTG